MNSAQLQTRSPSTRAGWSGCRAACAARRGGGPRPPPWEGAGGEWVTRGGKPLGLPLAPGAAARLAVEAATAADQRAAAASDALLAANAAAGSPLSMRRAEHRREHLDEIERVRARR